MSRRYSCGSYRSPHATSADKVTRARLMQQEAARVVVIDGKAMTASDAADLTGCTYQDLHDALGAGHATTAAIRKFQSTRIAIEKRKANRP